MENYLGRKVIKEMEFKAKGTFQAYYEACTWMEENKYNYGSTCVGCPMGFMKKEWDIPWKWRNMTNKQRDSVDGVMTGNIREGSVYLYFFN